MLKGYSVETKFIYTFFKNGSFKAVYVGLSGKRIIIGKLFRYKNIIWAKLNKSRFELYFNLNENGRISTPQYQGKIFYEYW